MRIINIEREARKNPQRNFLLNLKFSSSVGKIAFHHRRSKLLTESSAEHDLVAFPRRKFLPEVYSEQTDGRLRVIESELLSSFFCRSVKNFKKLVQLKGGKVPTFLSPSAKMAPQHEQRLSFPRSAEKGKIHSTHNFLLLLSP